MPQDGVSHWAVVFVGILLIISMCYAGMKMPNRVPENYCEMLELYCNTGGDKGLPDYHGIAEERCYK